MDPSKNTAVTAPSRPEQHPLLPHQSFQPPPPPLRLLNLSAYRRFSSPQELAGLSLSHRCAVETWYTCFNALIDYAEVHGDCNVPAGYGVTIKLGNFAQQEPRFCELGNWVQKQRYEKLLWDEGELSSLTTRSIAYLDSINFCWTKGNKTWHEQFAALQAFQAEHGHCNVPRSCKISGLNRWVRTQRADYKKKRPQLSDDKIEMPNSLDFEWDGQVGVTTTTTTTQSPARRRA